MANHGPLCERIKSDKKNILKSTIWKRQWNYNWFVSKVLQYINELIILFLWILTSQLTISQSVRDIFLSSGIAVDEVSMTQHSDSGDSRTRDPSIPSLYPVDTQITSMIPINYILYYHDYESIPPVKG